MWQPGHWEFRFGQGLAAMRLESAGKGCTALRALGDWGWLCQGRDFVRLGDPRSNFRAARESGFGYVLFEEQAVVVAMPWIDPGGIEVRDGGDAQVDAGGLGNVALDCNVVFLVALDGGG